MLGDDVRKRAKARNPRPAQAKAAADEEPEALQARDGARKSALEGRRLSVVTDAWVFGI